MITHLLRCAHCGSEDEHTPKPDDIVAAAIEKPCHRCWTDPAMAREEECDGKHGDFGAPLHDPQLHHAPHKVTRMPCSWMRTYTVRHT